MQTTVHRPLKITAFNVNSTGRQVYEVRKRLQYLKIDMALFLETYLKPHMRFYIQKHDIYRIDCQDGHKGGTAIAVNASLTDAQIYLLSF
jgi:hypothetical protein